MNIIKIFKLFTLSQILYSVAFFAQEIPINDLLYPEKDFEFTLSPNGKYMASLRKTSNGFSIIITDIENIKIAYNIPLGNIYTSNLNWISERRVSFEQIGILYAINIDGTENEQLMGIWKKKKKRYFTTSSFLNNLQSTKLLNSLSKDFEHILIETRGVDDYPIIYELNIYTGEKTEIVNGDDYNINKWLVDRNGVVRLGIRTEDGEIKFFTKDNEEEWESKNKLKLDMEGNSFINQKLNFIDFDYNENIIYLSSSVNSDRWFILAYDVEKMSVVDTVLSDDKYDIGNPIFNDTRLLFLDSEKKLVGVRYEKDKPYTEWFSEKFQEYHDTLSSIYPEYYVDILDWSFDGSVLLVKIFSDVDPGHIIIYNAKTNKRAIFSTYAKELLKYDVSYSKIIRYKTRDGMDIEGYMNLPLNGDGNWPFIIIPHGGPFARDYWRYDPVVQFFTNNGFGVLKVNFRGSTGYGITHLLAGVKQISTIMIDDIADGVKWIINEKYADSNNIFIYGHSYGGYAAIQSVIRYQELYNAAVSIAAPTDIAEIIDHFDDLNSEFNYEFWKTTIGDPDDEDVFLESISPIKNIDKITRPIFLFHGENDEIIPLSQTEDFIEEAEDIGKTFSYKIIKEATHSISENRNIEFLLRKSLQFYKENIR